MVRTQAIELDETAAIEKNVEAFPSEKLSLLVLAAGAFRTTAGFGFLIELAKPIDIIYYGHEEKVLGRERKVIQLASGGIITKAPALSTELAAMSRQKTRKSCAPRRLALIFSQGINRATLPLSAYHVRIKK
jgi:hypothetical protein